MPHPGSRPLPGLRIDRVEVLGTELDYLIVRVAGAWERAPIEPPRAVLLISDKLEQVRFDPLQETSRAAVRAARGSAPFRATYSVPVELRPTLEGELALDVGGRRVAVPPLGSLDEPPDTSGKVVGRAELAERRARRAEQAEETNARRAADAEEALAGLEADLAKLELRLERATLDRDDLEVALAERERQARRAEQRAEAEQRRREEAVDEVSEQARRAGRQHEALAAQLAEAQGEADGLAAEAEHLRRRIAETEHAAVAPVPAPAPAGEAGGAPTRPARLRGESRHAQRLASDLPRLAPAQRARTGPLDRELIAAERALSQASGPPRARRAELAPGDATEAAVLRRELGHRDALIAELRGALDRERSVAAADAAAMERTVAELRSEVQATLARAQAVTSGADEALVRDVTVSAGRALAGAETRIDEAQQAVRSLQEELAHEREQAAAAHDALRAEVQRERAVAAELASAAARAPAGMEAAGHWARAAARLDQELAAARETDVHAERIARLEATVGELLAGRARRAAPGSAPHPGLQAPWLPEAVRELVTRDPETAARLLVQLVPGQAAQAPAPLDYDLCLESLGCFAVALGPGPVTVRPLAVPRPRRHVGLRVETDALGLLELLEHGGVRRLVRSRRVRVRATWRRTRALAALPPAPLGLGALAGLGVWPSPGLVLGALVSRIEPGWTAGHSFTVAQEIVGPSGGTWFVRIAGRAPVAVTGSPPSGRPDARIRLSQRAFQELLDGRTPARGDRPAIRGDARAAGLVGVWTERAQRLR